MQPTTRKIELEARPISRTSNMKIMKSELNQQKSQKVFRLSFTNFKFKKQSDADILASPQLTNRENKEKQAHPQLQQQQQQQIQPKTIRIDNLFSPTRTDFRKFTSPVNMMNKQPAIRIVKYQPASPSQQQEIKFAHPEQENKKFGHKRSITLTNYPRGYGRVPSTDLIVTPSGSKSIRQLFQSIQKQANNDENSDKLSFMYHDGKINPAGNFYVDVPGNNLEGEESPQMRTEVRKFHRKTNSVSDSLVKTAKINYSTSVSSHTTLHDTHSASGNTEDEKKISNFSQEKDSPQKPRRTSGGDAIKIEVSYNKHFKTIEKIYEAKQKAEQINDQMIRQTQFIQNDEEEEANFQELYDALNSHL